jgi:hypothetical protein
MTALRAPESQNQPHEAPKTAQSIKTEKKAPRTAPARTENPVASNNTTPKKETAKEDMSLPDNSTKPAERKRLIVTLQQTNDADGDIATLHQLMDILKDYPGADELNLVVNNGTKVFRLKMGQIRVGCCDDLRRRIMQLVGDDALELQTI